MRQWPGSPRIPWDRCLAFPVGLIVFLLLSSGLARAEGEQWGIRKYAEELPRYRALVQQLETQGRDLDARRQRCAQAIDAVWSDWTVEERLAGEKAYESRKWGNNALGGGRALMRDRMEHCRNSYREALEQPNPVDPAGDQPAQQAYRDLLWGAHIKYLRSRNQFYDYDARYQEDKLQYLKGYIPGLFNQFIGFDLGEFIEDTLDDAGYVLAAHANAFFDELLKCGVKEVVHYVKQWAVYRGQIERLAKEWTFKERWKNPPQWHPARRDLSGGPQPSEFNSLGIADCIEDVTRAMVVCATVNGLRKNFVDAMVDEGVDPLVAEFWWSKYILQEEKPSADDPRAARVRGAYDVFTSRLETALESAWTKDFGLEQAKKSMEDELERQASKRIYNDVMQQVRKEMAEEMRSLDPSRRDGAQAMRIRQRAAERARELGKEKVQSDAHLKFLDALDWGAMLMQQAVSSGTYVSRWYDFDTIGASLVEEYHRIENCMVKQKLTLSGPAILAIYQMPEKELQQFFSRCDDIEADQQMLWAQRLLPQMQRHHNAAKAAADQLASVCADGPGRLQMASSLLAEARAEAQTLLDHIRQSSPLASQIEPAVETFETRAEEAGRHAEAVVEARTLAEAEAEKACSAAQDYRAAQDATAKKTQQEQCELAAKSAEQAVADAVDAFNKSVALRDAVKAEADTLGQLMEKLLAVYDGADAVLKKGTEIRKLADEAARMASTADAAWERLKKARIDAEAVLKKADEKVARTQNPEAQGLLANIVSMGDDTFAWVASYENCPAMLRTEADKLTRELQTFDLTETAIREQVAGLPDKGDLTALENRAKQAVADVASAVDVGEAFLDVAGEAGRDAQTCLKLLIGSREGGPAEIAAAAEAAIDACRFDEARTLIDRLLQGPQRDRLMQKLTEAQRTEQRVDALRSEADRLAQAGDIAGAKSRLQEAGALSVCPDKRREIEAQLASLESAAPPTDAAQTSTATDNTEPNAAGQPDEGFADLGTQPEDGTQETSSIITFDAPVETPTNTAGFDELPANLRDDDFADRSFDQATTAPPQRDANDNDFADLGNADSQTPAETVTYFDRPWMPRTWQIGDTQSTQVNIYDTASCLAMAAALANCTEGSSDTAIADQIRAAIRHMQAANQYSFAPHKAWPDWEQRAYQFNVWAKRVTQESQRQRDIARQQLHSYLSGQANGMKMQLETLLQGQAGSAENCDSLLFQIGYHLAYAAQLQLIAEDGLSAGKDRLWANRILSRVDNSKATAGRLMGMVQPSVNRRGCPDMGKLVDRVRAVRTDQSGTGQTLLAIWQDSRASLQTRSYDPDELAGEWAFSGLKWSQFDSPEWKNEIEPKLDQWNPDTVYRFAASGSAYTGTLLKNPGGIAGWFSAWSNDPRYHGHLFQPGVILFQMEKVGSNHYRGQRFKAGTPGDNNLYPEPFEIVVQGRVARYGVGNQAGAQVSARDAYLLVRYDPPAEGSVVDIEVVGRHVFANLAQDRPRGATMEPPSIGRPIIGDQTYSIFFRRPFRFPAFTNNNPGVNFILTYRGKDEVFANHEGMCRNNSLPTLAGESFVRHDHQGQWCVKTNTNNEGWLRMALVWSTDDWTLSIWADDYATHPDTMFRGQAAMVRYGFEMLDKLAPRIQTIPLTGGAEGAPPPMQETAPQTAPGGIDLLGIGTN